MTFKHIDFSSSETMRSLERLALEKGLVKLAPMKKEAAAKPLDLVPTNDLMQNVIKLCSGLMANGFVKEAKELESNFLAYKQAQTLYETSKEEGKDLIEAAHPQGSHKMSNIDADEATVEDILDKHKKLMAIMDKTPTGKLASSKNIIDAIKVATGVHPLALNGGKKALAQDNANNAPPSSSGGSTAEGVAGTIAIGVTGMAALKIIKSVSQFFGGLSKALKIVGLVNEAQLNAQSEAKLVEIAKALISKAGPEAAKTVAKDVGAQAVKAVIVDIPEMAGAASTTVATNAAPAIAGEVAKAGVRGWLTTIPWTAGQASVTTAFTNSGIGGALGAGGAVFAAGAAGLIIGRVLAQYVFFGEYIETIAQIGAAGDKVLSDMASMSGSFDEHDKEYVQQFAESLAEVKRLLPNQQKLTTNPSKDDVVALLNFSDVLGKSTTIARNIWGSATAHIDDQFLGRSRGFSNVKAHAQNYIDAANKIRDAIIHASQEFRKQIDEQVKASGGGTTLMTDYQTANDTIELYKAQINAKRLPNAAKMIAWLESMKTYIKEEADEFNKVEPILKREVATDYVKRMKDVQERLTAFSKEIPQ